jgi:hypothetical protein
MELQSAPPSGRLSAPNASPWTAQVRPQPNGRFRITSTDLIAIGMEHPDRVLDTDLWGRPAKVLLLDQPLKLGDKFSTVRGVEFDLRRVRLHELPGWPPRMASSPDAAAIPSLMDCALRSTTYAEGTGRGQESVELVVEHARKTYQAWLVGCPIVLLKCVEATLNQEACIGKTLSDLQDIPLIGGPRD